MKVAFLLERQNYYRLFGPIVDRALERGWETECWHDGTYPRTWRSGSKSPATFRHGQLRVRSYRGTAGLPGLFAEARPDVVISLRQAAVAEKPGWAGWFGLQYTLDVADLLDGAGETTCDGIGLHTEYWRDRTADCLRIKAYNRSRARGRNEAPVDGAAVAETLRRRATLVGIPEMDQCHWIDPSDVRRRHGIDRDRPVVLYCPFPFRSNPRTFWTRHVYGARVPWQRLAVRLAGRTEYQSDVARGLNDQGVVNAVRAFCDRNGAVMIVKARAKDPVPGYLSRNADRVLYDDAYYPATILELLKISALCLHFSSTVAYEAAYACVPSICLAPSGDDLGLPPIWQEWFLNVDVGGSFNFPGVVYARRLDDFLDGFATARLSDFPLDPVARAHYVEKFVGFDDGKSSDRVLDAVQVLGERSGGR
jgi:hypothetical protein